MPICFRKTSIWFSFQRVRKCASHGGWMYKTSKHMSGLGRRGLDENVLSSLSCGSFIFSNYFSFCRDDYSNTQPVRWKGIRMAVAPWTVGSCSWRCERTLTRPLWRIGIYRLHFVKWVRPSLPAWVEEYADDLVVTVCGLSRSFETNCFHKHGMTFQDVFIYMNPENVANSIRFRI